MQQSVLSQVQYGIKYSVVWNKEQYMFENVKFYINWNFLYTKGSFC